MDAGFEDPGPRRAASRVGRGLGLVIIDYPPRSGVRTVCCPKPAWARTSCVDSLAPAEALVRNHEFDIALPEERPRADGDMVTLVQEGVQRRQPLPTDGSARPRNR